MLGGIAGASERRLIRVLGTTAPSSMKKRDSFQTHPDDLCNVA
jgi:hypothetical protein